MERPRIFDQHLEGKRVGDRLRWLGDYLNEVGNDAPTEGEWTRRWERVKDYLLWLAVEG